MEVKRMKYPIGVQDFEKLRRNGYTYIDKTAQVYEIAAHGNCYFLGRPRRFGKSLLLSTFEAYFLGKKIYSGVWLLRVSRRSGKNTPCYTST